MRRRFDGNFAVDRHHVGLERPDAKLRARAAAGVEKGRLARGVDEDRGTDRPEPLAAGDQRLAAVGAGAFQASHRLDADPARARLLRPGRALTTMSTGILNTNRRTYRMAAPTLLADHTISPPHPKPHT